MPPFTSLHMTYRKHKSTGPALQDQTMSGDHSQPLSVTENDENESMWLFNSQPDFKPVNLMSKPQPHLLERRKDMAKERQTFFYWKLI